MDDYGPFYKAAVREHNERIDFIKQMGNAQYTHEEKMLNKRIDASNKQVKQLSDSIMTLASAISNIKPIFLSINLDSDTDIEQIKKLINGLK